MGSFPTEAVPELTLRERVKHLEAEIDRTRPVVEAARAYRRSPIESMERHGRVLFTAVDALDDSPTGGPPNAPGAESESADDNKPDPASDQTGAGVGERCPACDSPSPGLHPAMQSEGEVQPCGDPWHGPVSPELAHITSSHRPKPDPAPASALPWNDVRVGRQGNGTARSHEEQICNAQGEAVFIITHDGSAKARANVVAMLHACNAHPKLVAERDAAFYEIGEGQKAQLEQGQRIKDLCTERGAAVERAEELRTTRDIMLNQWRDDCAEQRTRAETAEAQRLAHQNGYEDEHKRATRLQERVTHLEARVREAEAVPECVRRWRERKRVDRESAMLGVGPHVRACLEWLATAPTPAIVAARGSDVEVLRPEVYEQMTDDKTHLFWEALERSTILDRGEVVELVRAAGDVCNGDGCGGGIGRLRTARAPLRHLVEGEDGA